MAPLDISGILIGLFLLARLALTVYIRTHPEANAPRYDFETW